MRKSWSTVYSKHKLYALCKKAKNYLKIGTVAWPASRVIVPGGVKCLNDGYQHGCVLDLRGNLHLLLDPSNVEFVNQSLGIILVLTFTIKRTLRNTDFLVYEKMMSPPEGGGISSVPSSDSHVLLECVCSKSWYFNVGENDICSYTSTTKKVAILPCPEQERRRSSIILW